jgi:hypothetical protein
MSISKKIRFEVFKRDSFTCQYCGKTAPDTILHVDHIEPVSKGGNDHILNLVTSCRDCNLGKSNRRLDDSSVVEKQKRQLEELQERKEQIKMMVDWQKELMRIDNYAINSITEFWEEMTDGFYPINESGEKTAEKLINKYGFSDLLKAMRTSFQQYAKYKTDESGELVLTYESAQEAFNKIAGILSNWRYQSDNPNLKEMYYIRGILRNRLSYVNEKLYYMLFKNAVNLEIEIEEIKEYATQCHSWTDFRETIESWIEEAETDNE